MSTPTLFMPSKQAKIAKLLALAKDQTGTPEGDLAKEFASRLGLHFSPDITEANSNTITVQVNSKIYVVRKASTHEIREFASIDNETTAIDFAQKFIVYGDGANRERYIAFLKANGLIRESTRRRL